MLIQRWIFYDFDEIESQDLLFTNLSQRFGIYLVVFALKFFIFTDTR